MKRRPEPELMDEANDFPWLQVLYCASCGKQMEPFPGDLLAENGIHPKNGLFTLQNMQQLVEATR